MAKSIFLLGSLLLLVSSTCAISDNPAAHFIYIGCSEAKLLPNTSYAQNQDQLLTSINESAPYRPYNNFVIRSSNPQEAITALYQCRGDIPMPNCTICVLEAISELRLLCRQNFGGVIQMEGCSVRYGNSTFLGQQDTDVELRKCGPCPPNSYDSRRDMVLDRLLNTNHSYRDSTSHNIRSMAQCMGDLSPSQCRDCVTEAVRMMKQECSGTSVYGDMFLGKCYVRYTIHRKDHRTLSRTAKIIITIMGCLLTVLALLILLQMFLKLESIKGKLASQQPTSKFNVPL